MFPDSGSPLAGTRAGEYESSNCSSDSRKSSSKSSVVVLNRKTPKILPWGQPPVTGRAFDHDCPTRTDMVRLDKKVASNLITLVDDLVRVAPDCNRNYCEDSFSGYSGSV